jgi:hypothetical protein
LAEILERFAWRQLADWSESQPALGLAAERRRDRGWHGFSRQDRARVEQNQKLVPVLSGRRDGHHVLAADRYREAPRKEDGLHHRARVVAERRGGDRLVQREIEPVAATRT